MKKTIRPKYILFIMVSALLLNVLIPMKGAALEYGSFKYSVVNNTIRIDAGPSGDVVIPDTIDGMPVTEIGASAFDNQYNYNNANKVTSVSIPDTVTTIGSAAFQANLLKEVQLPSSLVTIGGAAFNRNKLEEITIPSSVKGISAFAFERNKLTSVTMLCPSNVIQGGGIYSTQSPQKQVTFPYSNEISLIDLISYTGGFATKLTISNVTNGVVYQNGEFIIPEGISKFTFQFSSVEALRQNGHQYTGTYTVNFVYPAENVIVNYVDTEGNALTDPVTITGNIGDPYTTETKEFPNWLLTEQPANASGILSDETQVVNYVYEKAQGNVTVMYKDEDGYELAEPSSMTGAIGDAYTTSPKEIEGYELKEVPDNATGTYTTEDQTVTYVYEKAQGNVIVKYVDEEGNEIAGTETLTGKVGTDYEATTKDIAGYQLKEIPQNVTGTYKTEDQTITYVYEKALGNVIVKYADEDGNEIAGTETLTGKVGTNYETTAKDIAGYQLKEEPRNATGKFMVENQYVFYVYTKAEVLPNIIPDQPSSSNNN
ncbi:MucBP domain-containing protein, partial [Listeria ilorinensis]|uniref:MucBP domain-containing protein n=1 Tax=Listeria ilorinensis TaxID=2867439 RepID=UPI001EF734A1